MVAAEIERFLEDLREKCIKMDVPVVPEQTGYLLHDLCICMNAKSILEIGSAHGYSTVFLATALRDMGGKVVSCEMSQPSYEAALRNFEEMSLSDVINLRFGKAQEIIPTIDDQFDLVFVDGMKAEYEMFFDLVVPKLRENGLMIFDNVTKFPEKTKDFWERIRSQDEFQWITLPAGEDDDLLLIKRF